MTFTCPSRRSSWDFAQSSYSPESSHNRYKEPNTPSQPATASTCAFVSSSHTGSTWPLQLKQRMGLAVIIWTKSNRSTVAQSHGLSSRYGRSRAYESISALREQVGRPIIHEWASRGRTFVTQFGKPASLAHDPLGSVATVGWGTPRRGHRACPDRRAVGTAALRAQLRLVGEVRIRRSNSRQGCFGVSIYADGAI